MVAQNGFRQFSLFEIIVPFNYNSSYIHRQFGFQCTIPAFVPLCGNPICTSITIYRNCRYSFGFFSLLVFLLGFFQQFHLSLDIHICILFLVLSSQSQHSPYNWSVKLIHSQYLYVKMHLSCFLFHTEDVEDNIQTSYGITWCFSDRASWIDYILITNFCALIIIYS